MAWIKTHARDLFFFSVFAVVLANCTLQKDMNSCKSSKWAATDDSEATVPTHDELREMSCSCAAGVPGDDCADDLFDNHRMADKVGCSDELDALLFCVEDGTACDADGESACEEPEAAWRACIDARVAPERIAAPERDVEARRPTR